jgi:16S rRNA C967 or C1407 C5-methylase (RsmB/RsmF family)/NOL1/NOP2/fmu family ribosome biogenesis protein
MSGTSGMSITKVHFPAEFEARMKASLGNEWPAFKDAHQAEAPVSVRCNPEKNCPWTTGTIPWTKYGHYLPERPLFTLDPHFHGGAYYVQEASSMFIEQAFLQTVTFDRPLKVLDLSAAPGGKSTHLLSLMRPDDLLISNEVIRSRASVLAENILKWGYENCIVVNNDPADFRQLENFFDVILVDAPCSGEGLFRKDPDASIQWTMENAALCTARQKRIVHDVWPALKPGGSLIYSTCTYNAEENENNLAHFAGALNAASLPLTTPPSADIRLIEHNGIFGYQFMPHRVSGEGFFLSVLQKGGDEFETRTQRVRKPKLVEAHKKIAERLSEWVGQPQGLTFLQHNDLVFALRQQHAEDLELILTTLRFVYAGVNVATVFRDKGVPEHALALSRILNREHFVTADLSLSEALKFLKKESILLPDKPKGYVLITYQGTPIGWGNNLVQRVNNLYPADLKIRMELPR